MSDNLREYKPSGALFPKTGGNIDYSGQIDISEEVFEDLVAQYKKNKEAMKKDNLSLEQVPYLKVSLVGWRKMGRKGAFLSIVCNKFQEYNPRSKSEETKVEEKTDVKPDEIPDDLSDIM
tara:strand:- start:142 stop:501 length:360 start_codon:yes stop_codon:yes gene_type:complete